MWKQQQTSVPNSAFFLIPNPIPLLRSFDIPEPVIHPPGIDPYSVLNPKSGLESLPALDADPRAASLTEIITRTTDLTASEHAGGTLGEPAIKSTTSHSPASSQVVAQETVNDVTGTKIRSKNTQPILCDVCYITCNTDDMLKRHKEGKKHLMNMQKLAFLSTITQQMRPPAENDTICQESEKKQHHDLLQNEASVDSLFVCGISDVGQVDQVDHVTSGPLCRDGVANPTSVSTTPVQTSNSGSQKAQDKLKVHRSLWCKVCKVSCSSDKNLGKHILGKKHQKNLKNSAQPSTRIASMAMTAIAKSEGNLKSTEGNIVDSEVEEGEIVHPEEGKSAWCELCKVSCSIHASGKENMKNLQKTQKIPDLPKTLIASLMENPKSTKGEIIVNSEEGKSARCEICGIGCNSYDMLNIHMSGKKHQKNIKKAKKLFGHAPAAEGSLQEPEIEEGEICD